MFEDSEKTKELEKLGDLNTQIFEVLKEEPKESNEEIQEEGENFFEKPTKISLKKRIKTWWNKCSKKQKIGIISGVVLFLAVLVLGVLLLSGLNKKEEKPKQNDIVFEEENYRYENGNLIFLNKNKEEIGRYTCENKDEKLCFVAYYSNEENLDVEKIVYEDNTPVLIRSSIILDTYVFISDNPKKETENIKLYNIKEQKNMGNYKDIKKGSSNNYILKNENNLYGTIEINEQGVVPKLNFNYQYLGFMANSKNAYVATENNRNFVVDESGKNLSKAVFGTIKSINENYIATKLDSGKYEVYNYNNQSVLNESYDYVSLYGDFVILINDTNMYLKFYDKNKLNEEAIILNNKDYVKTSVYDNNKNLKETKMSFGVEENNEIITITVAKNSENNVVMINKAEGVLSKSIRNINYFDGKLYIYNDIEKTNLMGAYTCSNKNDIGAGVTNLKNCGIAEDTIFEDNDAEIPGSVGAIPIFNERFVFIYDNPDLVNDTSKTIVLYDLKKSTSLGKYREVNTYSYTGTKDITFSTTSDLQVVAKNPSGNYGVLKITKDDIAGHIGFNYSSIERLRDTYVAKDSTGFLLLSKTNGSSLTKTISYKIRNYNKKYVKVKRDDGKYYIYDYENKAINTKGFEYVELYDTYFAGVVAGNKLGVFTYEKPDFERLENNIISGNEFISLHSTKYYGNGILAFKLEGENILVDGVKKDQVVKKTSSGIE